MSNFKTHQDFTNGIVFLTTSVKEAWLKASELALAAVDHYYHGKDADGKGHDTSWVTELAEAFSHMPTDFDKCYAQFILLTTNIKLRQDLDDLSKPVYCITRGNRPEGSADQIASVEKDGLVKYASGLKKSANKAKLMNRDGIKEVKKDGTAPSATGLDQSELGKQLVEAANAADKMAGQKAKEAQKASEWFKETIAAIESGEPMPVLDLSGDMPDTDLARGAIESAQKLVDMARASGENPELDDKLQKIVTDTNQQFTKPLAIALGIIAKRVPSDEVSDDDSVSAAA